MSSSHPSPMATVLLLSMLATPGLATELRAPACDELADWLKTVNPNERWEPFAENKRIWLPAAMQEPEFQALFARSAMEWTQADIQSARTIWGSCIQQAKRDRDVEQRDLLQNSRRYLTSNLRDLVRYQERSAAQTSAQPPSQAAVQQQQAVAARQRDNPPVTTAPPDAPPHLAPGVAAGVKELLAAPPSAETLIVLGSLRNLDTGDTAAMQHLEREFGYASTPGDAAGYRITRELRARGAVGFAEEAVPRIEERLQEIKPTVLDQLKAEFSQNPEDIYAKKALAQRYESLMKKLEGVLTAEEYQALADETRAERRRVVDRAVDEAKQRITQLPPGQSSIAAVDRIVGGTAQRGLDIQQRKALVDHARARQRELANLVLTEAATKEIPAVPETLAGLKELSTISQRMLQGVVQKADKNVIQSYVDASDARLAEVGRKVLPEYRDALDKFPEDAAGLARAEHEVADKEGWMDMEAGVRGEFVAIAKARRDEIAAVVNRQQAERNASAERERRKAIAAGGDARLVGTEWVDTHNTMRFDFRDRETVFIQTLGLKVAGTYTVSRDDVVVKGPHGQLVYTLADDRMTGNGAVFVRQGR